MLVAATGLPQFELGDQFRHLAELAAAMLADTSECLLLLLPCRMSEWVVVTLPLLCSLTFGLPSLWHL